jgi:excisionase family DNA binding protein
MDDVLSAAKLTIKEACELVRVSRGTLHRWREHGIGGRLLPSVELGGKVFILREDLLAFAVRRGDDQRTNAAVVVRRQEAPNRSEAALQKLTALWSKSVA